MLKKLLCCFLSLMLVASLAACDSDGQASSTQTSSFGSSQGSDKPTSSSDTSSASSQSSSASSKPMVQPPSVRPTTMTKRTAFYAPRQAVCVYTVSVEGLDADTLVMLRSLQGLIARYDSAALYLVDSTGDQFWKNYATDEIGIYFRNTTVDSVIGMYSRLISGTVLYTADTFEYEVAFNMATEKGYLIATEQVAHKYGLNMIGKTEDIRNLYKDKREAYDSILSDGDRLWEYLCLAGQGSAFADYAYAVGALMLDLDMQVEWERAMLERVIRREGWVLPAVAFTEGKTDDYLTLLSSFGFGALQVSGLSNATFLSSATISKKYTVKQPTVGAPDSAGTVCLSFLIESESLGDSVNLDYTVWSSQNGAIPVAYEMPLALAELAPSVILWYSDASAGSSRLVARGWTDIDQKAMPYDIYLKWHKINNALMPSVGLDIVTAETLREDSYYGESFGDASDAAGIFVLDSKGEGSAWLSEKTPVIVSVNAKSLPALDALLSSMTAPRKPHYYLITVSAEVFTQPYTYEATDLEPEKTVYFSDILQAHTSREDVKFKTLTAENLLHGAHLYYLSDLDRS